MPNFLHACLVLILCASKFSVTQGTVGLIFLAQTIPYVAGAIVAGIISDFAVSVY